MFQIAKVAIYVNDINLTKTLEEFEKIVPQLKMKVEMKDHGKTHLDLDLKFYHYSNDILVH